MFRTRADPLVQLRHPRQGAQCKTGCEILSRRLNVCVTQLRPIEPHDIIYARARHISRKEHLQGTFTRLTSRTHRPSIPVMFVDKACTLLIGRRTTEQNHHFGKTSLYKFTNSTADIAASNPLFPAFTPARSIACSRVSAVTIPYKTGTPDSIPACAMPLVTSPAIYSKCGVWPRMIVPQQITASNFPEPATFRASRGISNEPGTLKTSTPC